MEDVLGLDHRVQKLENEKAYWEATHDQHVSYIRNLEDRIKTLENRIVTLSRPEKQQVDHIEDETPEEEDIRYYTSTSDMEPHLSLRESVRDMMRCLKASQLKNADKRKYMSPYQFLKEYCMGRIGGPRQSGHTETVKELITELHNKGKRVLLFAPFSDWFTKLDYPLVRKNKLTYNRVDHLRGRDADVDVILIDGASEIAEHRLDEILKVSSELINFNQEEPVYALLLE